VSKPNTEHCVEQVADRHGWGVVQCSRMRVVGQHCKIHDPKAAQDRREASERRRKEKRDRDVNLWLSRYTDEELATEVARRKAEKAKRPT
jgi:hypothetical protein